MIRIPFVSISNPRKIIFQGLQCSFSPYLLGQDPPGQKSCSRKQRFQRFFPIYDVFSVFLWTQEMERISILQNGTFFTVRMGDFCDSLRERFLEFHFTFTSAFGLNWPCHMNSWWDNFQKNDIDRPRKIIRSIIFRKVFNGAEKGWVCRHLLASSPHHFIKVEYIRLFAGKYICIHLTVFFKLHYFGIIRMNWIELYFAWPEKSKHISQMVTSMMIFL